MLIVLLQLVSCASAPKETEIDDDADLLLLLEMDD